MPGYRLIWFPHFQKSAGTTIVSLAKRNGESLYPCHRNGHPVDSEGAYLPIQDYSGSKLLRFVDHCQSIGCSFVAPSWGTGDLATLQGDERVMLIGCIREPWERFTSNYIFDFRLGYTSERDIENYVGSKRSYSYFNYYTHSLARLPSAQKEVSLQDLVTAQKALARFDGMEIVGQPGWLQHFCRKLDWTFHPSQANRRKNAWIEISRHLIRGRPQLARRMFESDRLKIAPEFEQQFRSANTMDYEIYALAREMASSQRMNDSR